MRSATSCVIPSVRTRSAEGALLMLSNDAAGAGASNGEGADEGFIEDEPPLPSGAVSAGDSIVDDNDRDRSFISFWYRATNDFNCSLCRRASSYSCLTLRFCALSCLTLSSSSLVRTSMVSHLWLDHA